MKTTIATVSLSAILACLTLLAQEPAQTPPKPKAGARLMEMFQKLDKNGDGKLTHEERRSLTNFGEMDTDKDGYRIDPNQNHAVITELDIRAYFAKAFGVSALRGPCLSAYNNFLPVAEGQLHAASGA